jgi:Ca2+-binding RTX toxin-like protein
MKRVLLFAMALAGLLVWPAATVSGAGQIVIRGTDGGSHLRVAANGGTVVIEGYLAGGLPAGCQILQASLTAICPQGIGTSIEFDMGRGDDKIEILNPLPVPVTAYLGGGSDKFIGSSESDTCYPQGARRNRCYGGDGNDFCITGDQNSDCVGDGGDDYCKHGAGSDGCWGDCVATAEDPCYGAAGNDTCVMGRGDDACHGGPGNDHLYAGSGHDKLYGGSGADFCDGRPGIGRSFGCEAGPGH